MRTVKEINLDLKDKWQTFTTKDGLASNSVHSILEDSSGNIWFGTSEGVSTQKRHPIPSLAIFHAVFFSLFIFSSMEC